MRSCVGLVTATFFVTWTHAAGAAGPGREDVLRFVEAQRASGRPIDIVGRFGKDLWQTDLSGADLRDANFREASFMRASLRGAKLQRADLRGAELYLGDFEGADMREADLQGATLDRTNLRKADLRGAKGVASKRMPTTEINLSGASLAGNDLRGADLSNADLTDADLSGADLRGAVMAHAKLIGARFPGAKLDRVILINADVPPDQRGKLSTNGAIATVADLERAVGDGIDLTKANFAYADLSGANLTGARMELGWFHTAKLQRTNLARADLRGAFLGYAHLEGVDLHGADLSEAKIVAACLDGANLAGAKLTGAVLARSTLRDGDFSGADLIGANLEYVDLTGAKLEGANLTDAQLDAAIIDRLRGVAPETEASLRGRAQRWKADLAEALSGFLARCFWLVYFVALIAVCASGIGAFRKIRVRSVFKWLCAANAMSLAPWPVAAVMILMGGSPVAQMESSEGWRLWFHAWPFLGLAGLAAITVSVGLVAYDVIANVLIRKRGRLAAVALFGVATLFHCVLMLYVLVRMAPDA